MNFSNFNVHGPDISFYQDADTTPLQVNFSKMKGAGAHFVIIKAGQRDYADPDYVYNWRAAKEAGIPRGSYWFYDSRADPRRQAEKWWSLIQDDPGELMHFLDLEENYNGTWKDWTYWYDCLYRFQEISGLPSDKIGIYTGYYWWIAHAPTNLISLNWFKRFPLWLASYNSQTNVLVPEPWTECLFWQYGTPSVGFTYGVESAEIDMNVFNGDANKFAQYFKVVNGASVPEEEETMALYEGTAKLTATPNVRVRRSYPDGMTIGAIQPGQGFKGDGLENGWMHVTEVGGVALVGWSSAQYLNYWEVAPEPPPPAPADEVTVSIEADIVATINGAAYHGVVMFDNVQLRPVE
jgi:lysozyme